MERRASLLVAAVVTATGCYGAGFDPDADGVFSCEIADDCPSTHSCALGVCRRDAGPRLTIAGPEEDSVFAAADSIAFPLSVTMDRLNLDEPGGEHVEGQGYLTVSVNDQQLGGPIISDAGGAVSDTLSLANAAPGIHRVRVRAFQLDGDPYANPSAVADVAIWVDDGAPRIGIRQPWPNSEHPVGDDLPVEVRCLNCVFIKPDVASGPRVDDPVPEGHTHVFFDRREGGATLDVPSCLPACNFEYPEGASIKPDSTQPENRVIGLVGQVPLTPGPLQLTATLNYTGHFPYPADNIDPAVWAQTPELFDQLVLDQLTIQLVE